MQASQNTPDNPNPMSDAHSFIENAEWTRGLGDSSDVVMSSRVRLARNIAGYPFPPQASIVDRAQILEVCKHCLLQIPSDGASRLMWINLHEIEREDRDLLVERHLMSRQHAKGKLSNGQGGLDHPRGLAIRIPDERLSIMVNEEDHLRIQSIRSGLALSDCLEDVNTVDDQIESSIDYAYHPRFGYLTTCPTNVGTGLRLSVMLHLPGLKISGELDKVKRAAHDMGLAVRGFYGEGSESNGQFYQISNQTTLGKSDEMILRELEQEIIPKVVGYERHARNNLLVKRKELLEDQVWRALGTLKHARMMQVNESMELLSLVRLGVITGMIDQVSIEHIHRLLLNTQPIHLQRNLKKSLTQQQRRTARAEMIRKDLNEIPH